MKDLKLNLNFKLRMNHYYINGVPIFLSEHLNLIPGAVVPLCGIKHKVKEIRDGKIFVEPLDIQTEDEGIINLIIACEELLTYRNDGSYIFKRVRKAIDDLKLTLKATK